MFDWNDLRPFLAVARTGSTLAAGRTLRVSQTTVARRITALEAATSLTLFERRQAGYSLTPAGESLLARALEVEAAARGFADAAAAEARDVSGTVRVTAEEFFAATMLAPILRDLREAHPAIRIELDTSDEPRDLAAGEADIAVRSSAEPTGGGLVGRRVGWDVWALYCSRSYAAAHGVPYGRKDLHGHALISGGTARIWRDYREWLRANGLEDAVAMHHDTVTGLLAAVRQGSGIAALPSLVADFDPELVRCLAPAPNPRGLWLLTHERVRHAPRVRTVLDFLADRLTRLGAEREKLASVAETRV